MWQGNYYLSCVITICCRRRLYYELMRYFQVSAFFLVSKPAIKANTPPIKLYYPVVFSHAVLGVNLDWQLTIFFRDNKKTAFPLE